MSKSVNLLVVEDNPADSDLIREYISEIAEFEADLSCVSTLEDARNFLREKKVHVVLVDLSLPDSRGLDTVRGVVDFLNFAPTIVLTSLDDSGMALKAIESGAQDYLLKGALNADVLARVIRHSLQRGKWLAKLAEVQEQFYRSQKMESIGRIASGIAHDFNNQLGAISILSTMAMDELDEEHSSIEHIQKIQEATARASDLVKKLMVFCRQNNISPKPFDVYKMVKNNETLFKKLMGANIKVVVNGSKGAVIYADPGLIEQAITNLVINARDAMNEVGTLTVEAQTSSENSKVIVKISDTGCGISKEDIEKIFEPFFTTKEIGKGTGLGLSMVQGAVTQSFGTISVESRPNIGTTFTLSFPYCAEKIEEDLAERKPVLVRGSGQTVLIVDDEDLMREAVAQILEQNGYHVVEAVDGVDALEKINQLENLELIVTDVMMPRMSGAELVKQARKDRPEVKVIFTSGYSAAEVNESHSSALENEVYLQKPFSVVELIETIQKIFLSP